MNASIRQTMGGGISAFTLKLIAILGMTLDHIAIVFGVQQPHWLKIALYAFGGLTFPIMAFLLVEGYRRTSNLKRYALRLLLFAIITCIPYRWAMREPIQNVLFTLLLGLAALYLYDRMSNRGAYWLAFAGLCLITLFFDWSLMGVPMILLYHTLRGKWSRLVKPVLIPIGYVLLELAVACVDPSMPAIGVIHTAAFAVVGCGLTIPLLAHYNGQRGRPLKYQFYLYYPGHLIVLSLIRGFLLKDWWLF